MKPSEVLEQFNHALLTGDPGPFIACMDGLSEYACDFLGPRECIRDEGAYARALEDMSGLKDSDDNYVISYRNGHEDDRFGTWVCEISRTSAETRMCAITIEISNEGGCRSFLALSCMVSS